MSYFKTNRTLQAQYTWQDIEAVQWAGDDKLADFLDRWNLVLLNLSVTIPEDTLIGANAALAPSIM